MTSLIPSQTQPAIDPATRLGHVHLTVHNLTQQVTFYETLMGFAVHWRDGSQAGLGAGGEDLLRLSERPDAPQPRRTTGLYHFAVLLP